MQLFYFIFFFFIYSHKKWHKFNRGVSGFDSSGRGYYFATRPSTLSPTNQKPQNHALDSLRPHYQQPQSPPSSTPSTQSYQSGTDGTSSSSSSPNKNQMEYAGAWGYSNNRDNNRDADYNRDKDIQG